MNHNHHAAASALLPLLGLASILLAYLYAVFYLRRKGRPWSKWRTLSFISGCVTVGIAILPAAHKWAAQDLRAHMYQHILIGMLAPIALVLAAPLTLALKTLPQHAARRLISLLRSRPISWLSHPSTALALNVGGMAILYMTPLYAEMHHNPLLHHAIHFHFLAAGCLFTWSIAGPDRVPGRASAETRLLFLFLAMATHATLSKAMYAFGWPQGTHHDLAQIHAAAKVMYYGGDLSELIVAIVFFSQWYGGRLRFRLFRLTPPRVSGSSH